MGPAEAHNGHNKPGLQSTHGFFNRVIALHFLSTIVEGVLRAADRAAGGLGMEPPVTWVVVLLCAFRAHWEIHHRRLFPVIGHILNYRVPGAAVNADSERVKVSSIPLVSNLLQAGLADRDIRRKYGHRPTF